jgi:hypothetical protein
MKIMRECSFESHLVVFTTKDMEIYSFEL